MDQTIITCKECEHCFTSKRSKTGYGCEVWGYDDFACGVPLDGWCFKAERAKQPVYGESKYREILKLDRMLCEAKIPHTFKRLMDGWQVCYPSNGKDIVMDAIEHQHSYGNNDDLLEIMGLLTEEESQHDSVAGWLTAENVFERIRKHYMETNMLI